MVADLDRFLQHQLDSLGVPGIAIAVVNDGTIVYHRALGVKDSDRLEPVDPNTLFESASISKPVFAYFVMRMVDQGLLDLDAPLYQDLPHPDLQHDDRHKLITARMVLAHTTGLPNWRSDNEDGKLDIKFAPGTAYRYSGEGYEYLALVLAHLQGTDLNGLGTVFRREVAVPLGMEHAYFARTEVEAVASRKARGHWNGKPVGEFWPFDRDFCAASCLHTEAASYAKFMIGFIEGQGLSSARYAEMLTPHDLPRPADQDWKNYFQGLGWLMEISEQGTRHVHNGSNGNFQSSALLNRERRFGYVIFTNSNRVESLIEVLEPWLTLGLAPSEVDGGAGHGN